MQSSLCRRVLKPAVQARSRTCMRATGTVALRRNSTKAYPELEDILGKPASTFNELVGQLETLIKHPSPPRNYADALAKQELRRNDAGDLAVPDKHNLDRQQGKPVLRQRPRMLRHPAADGAAHSTEELGMSEADAVHLGFTSEQQQRRRIWLTKVAGYRAFRENMMSADRLLDQLEHDRLAEAEEEQVKEAVEEPVLDDDREFEQLIRQSWRLHDNDVGGQRALQSRRPGGRRMYHTTRAVGEGKKEKRTALDFLARNTRVVKAHKSLITQADLPTRAELQRHVEASRSQQETEHVPIDATVNTGDVVELRQVMRTDETPFGAGVVTAGVIQKTTGRFHFNALLANNMILGGRETRVGFVARGVLFDEQRMRSSGVAEQDVRRVMEYAQQLRDYEAEHGHESLVSAYEAMQLQAAQNQGQQGTLVGSDMDSDIHAAGLGDEDTAEMRGMQTAVAEAADSEESITMVLLRTIPRTVRTFQQRAEQLMRSHYRELGEYWGMALGRGQRRVTVDSLAELIFGDTSAEARYAAYMHLISDTQHFIPDSHGLFVTGAFELRGRREVVEIERVRELIRENAPEFTQFVTKARALVAYSHAQNPTSPTRAALDPTLKAFEKSRTCELTGWAACDEVFERKPLPAAMTEEEAGRVEFSRSDMLFINILRQFVFWHNAGFTIAANPYDGLVAPVIKKMHYYAGCDVTSVTRFLVDLGVWPHWFNPKLNTRTLPFGSLGANKDHYTIRGASELSAKLFLEGDQGLSKPSRGLLESARKITPAVRDSLVTRSSVGIIDKTDFYARDVCEDLRHDFGQLPVYTIDDSATRDVDDGVSVETVAGADGQQQTWLHVHIADPTAHVHPGHVVADAAQQQGTTLYYAERHQHMLPYALTMQELALSRRADGSAVNTMTASVLLDANGEIADYKVRPARVRNLLAVPYAAADQVLSYQWAMPDLKSFAQVQAVYRNGSLVHPFELQPSDWQKYGDGCPPPAAEHTESLRLIQQLVRRHYELRVRNGAFTKANTERSFSLGNPRLPMPAHSLSGPAFLASPSAHEFPPMRTYHGIGVNSPAHAMVGELMLLAGRAFARFAQEHNVPMLFRVQPPPNLDVLSGGIPGLQSALADELNEAQAMDARAVWDAVGRRARATDGVISRALFDEVRHMMNPSVFAATPGPQTIMGVLDGYTRATSPIRRFDDLVVHWQVKAQLLKEHTRASEQTPWYWGQDDMERLAPSVFRRNLLADQCMALNEDFWGLTMLRRMENQARRGLLQAPPAGFYDTSSPLYYDLPWPYYEPGRPGPLTWTAVVDNRDESRPFVSLVVHGLGVRAMLLPRPVAPHHLPFAGTKVRVHVMAVDPSEGLLIVRLAPEPLQPSDTPRFWRHQHAFSRLMTRFPITYTPPEII
ncbi:RNB-domain-containing protein [Linderina pennispora]|uniref:RNB-domain-containing protein n=1 Tax=Linderina pennispora TaxID=61395 RepID=A0A1Y1W8F4_9FUNG|nr:RNB-domain-containing protein [Linderina pennispora]ORX69675.1 RNB-domain-containing protein [Linderina pennispora]